jgi:hypothetical protein
MAGHAVVQRLNEAQCRGIAAAEFADTNFRENSLQKIERALTHDLECDPIDYDWRGQEPERKLS